MKVIIAGSRQITDRNIVEEAIIASGFQITEVVCGMAPGVDLIAYDIAKDLNWPIKEFPANWARYKLGAGSRRNCEMAQYADALIAIWNGYSTGTESMINIATNQKLKVYVHEVA